MRKTKCCPKCKRDLSAEKFGNWRWEQGGACYECVPKSKNFATLTPIETIKKNKHPSGNCARCGYHAVFSTWNSYDNFCRANRKRNPVPYECDGCKQPKRPENVSINPYP